MAASEPATSPQSKSPKKKEELQDSEASIKELNEAQVASALSSSPKKESGRLLGVMIKDLDESQSELLSKIQGMKQNVQSWRSMVDTQLKSYQNELTGLKKQLETELEQLSSDFKELKTTLQKQQEDVTDSLRNLGLQDSPKHSGQSENATKEDSSDKAQDLALDRKDGTEPAGESSVR